MHRTRAGCNGQYEIYDLGSNSVLAAYQLGQVGTEWQVAGLGGFDGADTSDMILRNSNTGTFELYDISNNNITNALGIGQVGTEWQVAGFADFSSKPGETDMLLRTSTTGAFEVYDIANNQITSVAPMGQVGTEWRAAGFGDFSTRANETGDMLMRNSNTGAFEVYDVANNQITSAGSMGQVGLEWQVAGFGDFSGHANETDMLMRNSNTGAFELYDISRQCHCQSPCGMGQVGLGVAGRGLRSDQQRRRQRHADAQRQYRRVRGLRHRQQPAHWRCPNGSDRTGVVGGRHCYRSAQRGPSQRAVRTGDGYLGVQRQRPCPFRASRATDRAGRQHQPSRTDDRTSALAW